LVPALLHGADNPAVPALQGFAMRHPLTSPVAVAYSGGADSTALLLAAAQCWPGQVRAVHVHHGLQAAADDFARHCQQVCETLAVPLAVLPVKAHPAPGQSPEDAARRARYPALAQAARHSGCAMVLLAQHGDDQAETVMLALGRGSGLPGLAAMPECFERDGATFGRPLLALSAADIRQWLVDHGHGFVDDPSNQDTRYSRNRLRQRLMPALAEVLPHYRQTLARSARHAAQAQALLDEVAAQDLEQVGCPPRLQALQALSAARQANVLRHWLVGSHGVRPSAAQLDELLAQVAACTTRGHRIALKVATGHVRRQGPELIYQEA
jgi:tRNA(Ile)-lysidine synthase